MFGFKAYSIVFPPDTIKPDSLHFPAFISPNPFETQKYNSPLFLPLPSIYTQQYDFDPKTGDVSITQKIGDYTPYPPYVLDFNNYMNLQNRQFLKNYWREKTKTVSGKNGGFLSDILSPEINLGIKGLNTLFGSDKITVKPTGVLNVTLGLTYTKTNNPTLPRYLRNNTVFDFDQDVQVGVNGSVGNKMNIAINYNSLSMFDFEDKRKINYNGDEDEIIQKIEAGNVTFPLENTLITGSTTLWGIRTDLKFGKLTISSVLSQQKGQSKTIEIQGGAVVNDFEISASDYDANKHFFLNHYFRDHYEDALKNLPVVTPSIKITRIEVWVTNKTSDFQNSRNIVAFMDLGEGDAKYIHASGFVLPQVGGAPPSNNANNLYEQMTTTYNGIRDITQVSNILNTIPDFTEGIDYVKLENARKLDPSEYTVNTDLGYISLNYELKPGEVLAVAYEYTMNGKTYQVGEFSSDVESPKTLILKLIKGPALTPNLPNWDLMMKNIYSLNTFSLSKDDFKLEIYYNNDRTGIPINYIPEGKIKNQRLLSVFNFDKADEQNNPNPDGFFDFIEGVTVDTKNGLIIFPELEPFGEFLAKKIGDKNIAKKYTYPELYDSTQYIAKQVASKNKFYLKGHYKSTSGNEIMLNVMNLSKGSVKVTQGGRELTENVDYSVDYNIGKVTILNEALLRSGLPIKISIENYDTYGLITKNFVGTHLNYQFNPNFNLGGTFVHLSELPYDPKPILGFEPVSNSMLGLNTSFTTEAPWLTKLVDFLPFIQTKEKSQINFIAEFAYLIPGNPKIYNNQVDKKGVVFIDDFEDSQTYIDLKSPQSWVLASIPQHQPDLFPEASDNHSLKSGYNRALLAWYSINQDMLDKRNLPDYITDDDLSNHFVRPIYEKEIFPNRQNPQNIPTRLTVLNLAFYPNERGPYNFDVDGIPGISAGINPDGTLKNPASRWGGIMRDLYVNDFESSNIQYIEFWLMDPFVYDSTSTGGYLYINLGDISEDILKDSRKMFENGIPYPDDPTKIDTTQWGIVPTGQMTTQTFDNNPDARARQDAGFDGLTDTLERNFYRNYINKLAQKFGIDSKAYKTAINDPSDDDFRFYFDKYYDQIHASILDRYKKFNGTEGNSPLNPQNNQYQAVSFYPDMEDVNRDNTLDNFEAYYQYVIHLAPQDMKVGKNYIVNKVVTNAINLPNKKTNEKITWYQFKIPIYQPDKVVGNISGFKSIRFMRIFLRGFTDTIILRFAKMDLVRGEWRQYEKPLTTSGEGTIYPQHTNDGVLDVSVVNIEENSQKEPVNYVLPPGISREQQLYGQQPYQLNEQSLALTVKNLPDGEAKAVYKIVNLDLRKFKKIKAFFHAEALPGEESQLKDNDITVFIRLGSDFTQNYYEYEIPLKITPPGHYIGEALFADDRYKVWPQANNLDLDLQKLLDAKHKRNIEMSAPNSNISYTTPYVVYDGDRKITIVGNPNLSNVKAIMIGVRNPNAQTNRFNDDGMDKSAEIWVDELRLTDFNNNPGWAADMRLSANLADFGNITLSAYTHTPGFGSIEQRVNERAKDQVIEWDMTSQFQLGKFFPKNFGVSLPLYIGYSENISNPEYNPFDPDIKFKTALSNPNLTEQQKKELKYAAQTYVRRKSINLTNIKIQPINKNKKHKRNSRLRPPWSISNFTTSFAYNEIYRRTPIVEFDIQQSLLLSVNYNYSPNPKNIKPFSKWKLFRKRWIRNNFKFIKDFNFYYLPSRISFTTEINRQYNSFKSRDVQNIGLQLPISYQKNFLWDRNYDFTYKLSRNLKIDFSATNASRIEPQGWAEQTLFDRLHIRKPQDSIFYNIFDPGRNTDYNHQIRLNYRTPLNKLPLLSWTNLNITYSATYDWRRGQDPYRVPATDTTPSYVIDFGNMIQNSSTIRADLRLNFSSLYRKIPFLKDVQNRFTKNGRKPRPTKEKDVKFQQQNLRFVKGFRKIIRHKLKTTKITKVVVKSSDGQIIKSSFKVLDKNKISITLDTTIKNATVIINGKRKQPESWFLIASDYFLKSMMMLQSASFNYRTSLGNLINGYRPEVSFLGMQKINGIWAPGWNFITAYSKRLYDQNYQDEDITQIFALNKWLVTDTLFNKPFDYTDARDIRFRINIEPLNNFRIDLNFQKNITFKRTKYGYGRPDGSFRLLNTLETGNYFISFNIIKTAFEPLTSKNNYYSKAYENFKNYRQIIANRLARHRELIDPNYTYQTYLDTSGVQYPVGYASTYQSVLIPAFLAAYSGLSPDKIQTDPFLSIPLPDWRITFDGLGNLPFLKDFVSKITLNHSYSSTYTIANFQLNPNFDLNSFMNYGYSDAVYPTNGLFIPRYEISGIRLSEKFVPLLGLDIKWKYPISTRIEYKKTRDLFLSFSNNQITEHRNNTFTLGAGYTFKNLAFNIKVQGQKQLIKSDLNVRLDLSMGNDIEIYRRILENINDLNIKRDNFNLALTADYSINRNLNIQFYYNHTINETNTAPKTTTVQAGFKIKYNIAP